MVSQLAVVRDMAVRHDQIVVAEDGDADVGGRRAVDGDEFADGVEVADDHPRLFTAEFQILRGRADRAELKDAAAFADAGVIVNDGVRTDHGVFADDHVAADDAVRADFHAFCQLGVGRDDGGGMNFHGSPSLFL